MTAPPRDAVRRRASRAAGPANGGAAVATAIRVDGTTGAGTRWPAGSPAGSSLPPRRRPAHLRMVALVTLVFGVLAVAAVGTGAAVLLLQQRHVNAEQARDQRFVDTAVQTVVNMFSFNQDDLDGSVKRFVNATSGPLHDKFSQSDNVATLIALLRSSGASSEAVVNGAALERVDNEGGKASVLVSVRVTPSDMDGNNRPSTPYRLRVIVHEEDNGRMTAYDLMYPDGGN